MKFVIVLTLAALSLGGCFNPSYAPGEWPTGFAEQSYYDRIYEGDKANQNLQTQETYLTWVMRFYEGWSMAPGGWKLVESKVSKSIHNDEYPVVRGKLANLGMLISGEWCKHTSIRRVDTKMLVLWANVMRKAEKQGRLGETVDRLLRDVTQILDGSLEGEQIAYARYKDVLKPDRDVAKKAGP